MRRGGYKMEKVWSRASQFRSSSFYLLVPLTPLQYSGADAGIKLRPTNEELSSMSPEFDRRWRTFFANAKDKPVVLAMPFAGCAHLFLINPTSNWYWFFASLIGPPIRGQFFTIAYFSVCTFFSISISSISFHTLLGVSSCYWKCSHRLWAWSLC